MTSIHDAVDQMLAQAESMHDATATRVLRGLRDDLADSAQTQVAQSGTTQRTTAHDDPGTTDPHNAETLVRRQVEERSRLASALAAQPEAAARLPEEAQVLTLVLTRSGC